ncbi:MAG: hypothetical protein A3F41_04135 [Coxiella sp. RIFCSPHIGHO2_12_FULL_44_14]|nr:MAG: hypothetical protein A3F41_04135 [Coxiella sp. RIFCSPHIGHO2_12_FULL_44_14]
MGLISLTDNAYGGCPSRCWELSFENKLPDNKTAIIDLGINGPVDPCCQNHSGNDNRLIYIGAKGQYGHIAVQRGAPLGCGVGPIPNGPGGYIKYQFHPDKNGHVYIVDRGGDWGVTCEYAP